MPKEIRYDENAWKSLKTGIEKSARAIKFSLGPRGRNVMLDQGWGSPKIIKDGNDIADEIELSDPYENLAANMVKQAASKTNDMTGDGSTTTVVLTEAIFMESLKHVNSGANPMAVSRGIGKAADFVIKELKKASKPVTSNEQIKYIATVAAGNSPAVGEMLANAMKKVSKDGVITIEEGKGIETETKIVEGMQFDRGYISPYFITDQENLKVELNEPYILVYEEKLASTIDLIPLLEKIAQTKKPLLIIADEVEGDALAMLVVNKTKGILQCAAVKAPGYGDRRKEMLEDIAIMTDAEAIYKDLGIDLKTLSLDKLGRAKKVVIDSENTTLMEGAGATKKIEARIASIRKEIERNDSDYDKEKLQERLARLAGGIAQVNVGAATESELKEKKSRAESALHAVKAANEEGFVTGGGVTLLKLAEKLDSLKLSGDEQLGTEIMKKALAMPIRHIAGNAGQDGSLVIRKMEQSKDVNFGYDADKEEFTDLAKRGILDPAKVVRCAIQNASSVAQLILTAGAAIIEAPEEEEKDEETRGE
ncbi:MAG: chaperonin GroEL [Planctomycetes bacterium]|nr:chaperonin GroEL [Planctomycetota bacterium]